MESRWNDELIALEQGFEIIMYGDPFLDLKEDERSSRSHLAKHEAQDFEWIFNQRQAVREQYVIQCYYAEQCKIQEQKKQMELDDSKPPEPEFEYEFESDGDFSEDMNDMYTH